MSDAIVPAQAAAIVPPIAHQLTPAQLQLGRLLAIGSLTGVWNIETFDQQPRQPNGLPPNPHFVNLARAWMLGNPREWDQLVMQALEQSPEQFVFHQRLPIAKLFDLGRG